eukprot:4806773-Amphidinium_carterae.1
MTHSCKRNQRKFQNAFCLVQHKNLNVTLLSDSSAKTKCCMTQSVSGMLSRGQKARLGQWGRMEHCTSVSPAKPESL